MALRWWVATTGCAMGCAAAVVPEPSWVEPRPNDFVFAASAPPPPRVEQVPPQAPDGSVWVRGYPHWDGRRWNFRPGAWQRPRSGYRLTRWHWDVDGQGKVRYWPPRWTKESGQAKDWQPQEP